MTSRWFHGAEVGRQRVARDQFDPIAEGDRYGLAREVSLEIWERVCAEATDHYGRFDEEHARRRFHQVAERAAARGGRLRPDPCKVTRVEAETWGRDPRGDVFADVAPGKVTRVEVAAWIEARRGGRAPTAELPDAREIEGLMRGMSPAARDGATSWSFASALGFDAPNALDETGVPTAGGAPLEAELRISLEQTTGADLGDARVHTGPHAAALAEAVGAHAYTFGRDIVMGAGTVEGSSPWLSLLAHEATHVAQQRGAAPRMQRKAKDGADGGHEETAADTSARVFLNRTEAKNQEVTARQYAWAHLYKLIAKITEAIGSRVVDLSHPALSWGPGGAQFGHAVMTGLLDAYNHERWKGLDKVIAPTDPWDLIDSNRLVTQSDRHVLAAVARGGAVSRQAADGRLTSAGASEMELGPRGPIAPFSESVAIALASIAEQRLAESLGRVVPRYVAAAMAKAQVSEPDAEPAAVTWQDLVPSHPMDRAVGRALCAPDVIVVSPALRERAGDAAAAGPAVRRPRPVRHYVWLSGAGLWNWIRVTEPADATAEEVAYALFGDYTAASRLTASPPLFGLTEDDALTFPVARGMRDGPIRGTGLNLIPDAPSTVGDKQPRDLETQLAYSKLGDDAALAQSARFGIGAAGAGADAPASATRRDQALDNFRAIVLQLETVAAMVAPFGLGGALAAAQVRVHGKLAMLELAPVEEAGRWSDAAVAQRLMLGHIGTSLVAVVDQLQQHGAGDTESLVELGIVGAPPREIVAAYLRAAALAHLPETAWAALAEAGRLQRYASVDAMEAMLSTAIGRVESMRGATGDQVSLQLQRSRHAIGMGIRDRQVALRRQVAELRSRLVAGTPVDPQVVAKLFADIDALRFEAEVLSNLAGANAIIEVVGQIQGGAWIALAGQLGDLDELVEAGGRLISALTAAHHDWVKAQTELARLGETVAAAPAAQRAGLEQAAASMVEVRIAPIKARLAGLASDEGVRAYLQRAHDEIDDAQTKAAILQIAVLIGVTILSAGAGSAVAGFVNASRGARAGALMGELAGMAVESATMATVSAKLNGDSWTEAVTIDLATNLATLGTLRALDSVLDGTKLARVVSGAEDVGRGTLYLYKGVEIGSRALATAVVQFGGMQVEAVARDGKGLTVDQLLDQGKTAIAMMIGTAGLTRLAARPLDHLKALGVRGGELVRLHGYAKRTAAKLEQTGDPALARELLAQERRLIEGEIAELERLRADPEAQRRARIDLPTLDAMQDGATARLGAVDRVGQSRAIADAALEPLIAGRSYRGTAAEVAPVLQHYRGAGLDVASEADASGQRRHRVTDADGKLVVEIVERPGERAAHVHGAGPPAGGDATPPGDHGSNGKDPHPPSTGEHLDPKWLDPMQADAAHWQIKALDEDPRAASFRADPEFRKWFGEWMSQPGGPFKPDGSPRYPDGVPQTARQQLDQVVASGNIRLSTGAIDLTKRIQQEFPGMPLDPTSPEWQANRNAIKGKFGEESVRAFEDSVYQRVGDPMRQSMDQRLDSLVDPDALDSLSRRFPGAQIYVTGSAAQERKPAAKVTDLDVIIVVPDATPQTVRREFEKMAGRMRVGRGREAQKHGAEPFEVDAKVMTQAEFAGWGMLPTSDERTPLRNVRIDSTQLGERLGTGATGIDLHNHVMGVLATDYFVDKTGGGSAVKALENAWTTVRDDKRWKKKPGSDGKETEERTVQHAIEIELADAYADIQNHQGELPPEALEARARRALERALGASEHVAFDQTYDLRDVLVQDYVDPGGGSFKNFAADTVAGLADQGVTYSEQSVSLKKLANKFDEATMREVHEKLAAEGRDSDLRFLAMLPTNAVLSVEKAGGKAFTDNLETLKTVLVRGDVSGIDIAGPESKAFTKGGAENFRALLDLMGAVGTQRGRPLVLRPHVGEGYDAEHTGKHVETARHNLDMLLDALDAAGYQGPESGVIVRFGHAAHATPEQIKRMQRMGIVVEANLGSNLATSSVTNAEQHPLLYNLYFGTRTILSTDAQGVMGTNLTVEYQRAAALIEAFRAGETSLQFDGKVVRFAELDPATQERFRVDTLIDWATDYAEQVRADDRHDAAREEH